MLHGYQGFVLDLKREYGRSAERSEEDAALCVALDRMNLTVDLSAVTPRRSGS
jgi:hypothetical protein